MVERLERLFFTVYRAAIRSGDSQAVGRAVRIIEPVGPARTATAASCPAAHAGTGARLAGVWIPGLERYGAPGQQNSPGRTRLVWAARRAGPGDGAGICAAAPRDLLARPGSCFGMYRCRAPLRRDDENALGVVGNTGGPTDTRRPLLGPQGRRVPQDAFQADPVELRVAEIGPEEIVAGALDFRDGQCQRARLAPSNGGLTLEMLLMQIEPKRFCCL